MKKDWREAQLSDIDKILCSWVEKLTLTPGNMNKKDVEKLESVGFSQSAISDAAQVAGYFNYINRIADGLGVDLEDEMK
ncbi:MAG: peroxidase [Candidatus Marinimicrobia bacterium]|nr:peroxidase [Candidatus Neomarinimicrobiota bacterium]MDP6615401.1 peroxidase [Candidatus Neomarinimicrobiota bacterium]MDP6820612.1 peroxidase [Candidatus Neomarinimicrobiota bacterium]MDP6862017.1 peroxidase [Candidatus Neomarinimicrobiota bacterium]MEC9307741.1 peroxidase [Candidatus Neomarinimicrobiota bacterium]